MSHILYEERSAIVKLSETPANSVGFEVKAGLNVDFFTLKMQNPAIINKFWALSTTGRKPVDINEYNSSTGIFPVGSEVKGKV